MKTIEKFNVSVNPDTHCAFPDRDVRGIECGYPLPCPHHTVIFDVDKQTIAYPPDMPPNQATHRQLKKINKAISEGLSDET